MKEEKVNSKMKDIILVLHSHGGAMTANEISKVSGISYLTVKKYLNELHKKGIVRKIGDDYEAS